ncbi:MAG: phenylalanine-4-hydroxylase [Gracilimonas sp.]|nr:phenylalanine-4-hydroxylase [Gracilimonas sp.]
MQQTYHKYTPEDQEVWEILSKRQLQNLPGKAHPVYLNCLDELSEVLHSRAIPRFSELNEILMDAHGWSIKVVPGLTPVEQFFDLLKNRNFSASTWLRSKSQLNYLEEPDMFHDIFGHIPLLMNEPYAEFAQKLGALGVRYIKNKNIITQLQRLYWFTIEFGLIQNQDKHMIYGAGIISSSGETDHVMHDHVDIRPYNIFDIIKQDFITSEIQTRYFSLDNFTQLYTSIEQLEKMLHEAN